MRPDVRRKIGSLLAVEEPAEARSVGAGIARAVALRGSGNTVSSVLEPLGLTALAQRKPSSLSPAEARAAALALALSGVESAAVLALYEPLATPAGRARVVAALFGAAEHGVSVLCVTASARDAGDLGGRSFPLRFGRIGGQTALSALGGTAESVLELVVRTDDPRRLCAALSGDSALSGIRCELTEPGEVVATGADIDRLSMAVLRGSKASGVRILALWQRPRLAGSGSSAGLVRGLRT